MNYGLFCKICNAPIFPYEKSERIRPRREKTNHYHAACIELLRLERGYTNNLTPKED